MTTNTNTIPLVTADYGGKQVYKLENQEAVLVKKDDSGAWSPVDSITDSLSDAQLDQNYGLWTDQEVTKGFWRWKETVREKDGEMQPDEIRDFGQVKDDSIRCFAGGGMATCYGISEVAVEGGQQPALKETWFFAP